MKKLEFTFKNCGKVVDNAQVEYEEKEGIIFFKVKENSFEVKIGEEIKFVKRDKETVFEILKNSEKTECHYKLLENDIIIEINLENLEFEKLENGYTLKYTLESDPDNNKEIDIKFLK